MGRKKKIDVIEIVVRNGGHDTVMLRTCNKDDAIQKYTEMRLNDHLPRVKINGIDLPILEADQEFTNKRAVIKSPTITKADRELLRRIV